MDNPFKTFSERLAPQVRKYCTSRDADLFLVRLKKYFYDFYEPLEQLYGTRADFQQQFETLGDLMVEAYGARPEELRLLDLERHLSPDWFQSERMLGYVCYTDRFAGTLQGVGDHLDYLRELGVTYLHLMPLLRPRPGVNDGGYAVQDYRAVEPALGTMDNLAALASELHAHEIALCVDLVVNHTAKEHYWARRAMAGDIEHLDYYFTFPDRTMPDAYELSLREVFPDFAPGNFTWYPEMAKEGRWVWTTFNEFQWDLNYSNPAVFREMAGIMFFLANRGVDVLRLDAVPFMWKRLGTSCENLPEVHLLLQAFRGVVRVVAPAVIFKAEAILSPDKVVAYLGQGRATGKECELAYHNGLMVLLWSALASRKVNLLTYALQAMPPMPPGTTWVTYIRCHDDIGWAITDENAAAVGENAFLHRQFLNNFYSGAFSGSFARGAIFQYNSLTRDGRMSGTAASLAGLEQAILEDDWRGRDLAVRRILLLYSSIIVYGGIPLLYMGDELGLLNDLSYRDDPAKAGDNRWMHRPTMDWKQAETRHDLESLAGRISAFLRTMGALRSRTPALNGAALTTALWTSNPHVFSLARYHPRGRLVLLANFTEEWQEVSTEPLWRSGLQSGIRNLLDPAGTVLQSPSTLHLAPYESMWLV